MSWSLSCALPLGEGVMVGLTDVQQPLALIGPNGSGKSTLLRWIAGLGDASGRLEVDGQLWQDSSSAVEWSPQQRRVGYLPQRASLFPHCNVQENLWLALCFRGQQEHSGLETVIEHFSLNPLLSRSPKSLSGGERQRVSIARTLLGEPAMLLLDEPFTALDALARAELQELLFTWLQTNSIPAVFVVHNPVELLGLEPEVCLLQSDHSEYFQSLHHLTESDDAFAQAFCAGRSIDGCAKP